MPIANEVLSRDEELLLIVERDIPDLKESVEDMDEKISTLSQTVDECKTAISALTSKVDLLITDMNKEQLPWWKDFQKVLILLFSIGFMVLAGVKGASTLLENVNPINIVEAAESK